MVAVHTPFGKKCSQVTTCQRFGSVVLLMNVSGGM